MKRGDLYIIRKSELTNYIGSLSSAKLFLLKEALKVALDIE